MLALSLLSMTTAPGLGTLQDPAGSYELRTGLGRIDGHDFDVGVLSGFASAEALVASLLKTYAGTATVTPGETPHGFVVMISRLRSKQCPACPAPNLFNIDDIQRDSLTVTVMTAPGAPTFALASRVGDLLAAKPSGEPRPFEGEALRGLLVGTQSRYLFAKSRVHTAVADADPNELRLKLGDAGFRELEPSAHPESGLAAKGPRVSLWTKGSVTVGLTWTPAAAGRNTKVVISETASE